MSVSEEKSSPADGLGNRRSIQLSYGAERRNREESAQNAPTQSQREPNGAALSSSPSNNEGAGKKPQAEPSRQTDRRSGTARAFYNEFEPFPAEWIRNLAAAGHVAPGVVDERSITELSPADVGGATQAHFFAGVGVWSRALRLAGWADDAPVWTGSCPCQPFSVAGKRGGTDDARHLWPVFFRLITECRPPIVFGEQVASADGRGWLAAVRADLEGVGYAVGTADLCSAGVGAPNIRQRLYWVAYSNGIARGQGGPNTGGRDPGSVAEQGAGPRGGGVSRGMGDTLRQRTGRNPGADARAEAAGAGAGDSARGGGDGPLSSGAVGGFWADAEWIPCRDGKWRPVEPGTFPLAHGAPSRVGRLRAYGNAINAEVAATFIRAAMESGVRS